ncbi:NRT2.2 [Symbiodinium sp. CCMP2592]|nr:NRT2.2 [Symbiodinium sp. CCMP2592]
MADFKLKVDESNKATELPLLRICGTVQQNPHMRAFVAHIAWPPPEDDRYLDWRNRSRHLLREAFRRHCFFAFLAQDRRDSRMLRDLVVYDEEVVARARALYRKSRHSCRAVLLGAAWSSMCYSRARGEADAQACNWCGSENLATWHHIAWECPHFAQTRPARVPDSVLTQRLGWPCRPLKSEHNEEILEHLATVRETVRRADGFRAQPNKPPLLAFLGWFALAPLGLEVATSINMCENQKFPPAENPLRPAYLKYKSLKTGLEYCQYGKVKDGDVITDCAAVPADVMSSATATAEEKSPYAPSVLAKCVCTTGTECNGMIANAGVVAVASTIFVRIALGTLLERFGPVNVQARATFVTNQFWCSLMFAPNVIGTANATAAGWGNLGCGVTQIFMISVLFNPMVSSGMAADTAWRVAMIVPAVLFIITAVSLKLLCWDTPTAKRFDVSVTGKTKKPSLWDYVEVCTRLVSARSWRPLKATLPTGAVIEKNEGQGNCLPAAIAQALSDFTGKPRSQRGVRRSMVEWMRAHSLHLQPLWDQRNVQDELTTNSFEEYLSQVEQVNAYCGLLEVYALSKGLPANILVIDETAGHHIRFASQSDTDPFIVLRYAAKHYEWVRCDPAALVEIWTGAATGKTVGGRGGGPADSSLRSCRFMQVSTDSEAEFSGQAKVGGPQTIAQDGGAEDGNPLASSSFMQVPTDIEAEFPHHAHTARPKTFMQIDSASEIGTTAPAPAKRPSLDAEVSSGTCKRQRKDNSVYSQQTDTSAAPAKPNRAPAASGARKPVRDTWTWFCKLCGFTVRAPSKSQASQGRSNHLNRLHPGLSQEERAKLHKVRVEAEVVAPYKGELQVGGWMCFKCKRVLPPLKHSDRQASIRMHMQSCYGSRCPSHGENARRVFVSMGGACSKGKKPSPKAFSTAIVVTKKLRELRESSPHNLQVVGSFGKFYAITCLKCCARWKNLYCCLQDHRNPECCRDKRATNLQKFAKQRVLLPKGVPKLFLEAWKLRPSEANLARPSVTPDPADAAASAGHDLVCIQGESRQANSVKAGYRRCFTCRSCTQQWRSKAQVLKRAKQTPCGPEAREKALRAKVRFWARMSPKWRSDVAKAWSLSSKERRALDAAAVPTRRKASWIRDLTEEGIHPHPGPSPASAPLAVWSLNSQGAGHAWRVLGKVQEDKPHIFTLQEPNLDAAQAEQMLIRLGLCGYRAWHQPGSRTGTNRGGLVVAVRDDMRASLCHQSVGEFGNLMTLNLDAWLLTVVWRRPSPDTGDASFVQALAEHHALAHNHPWAATGDWNWCPDEHVFLQGDEFSASVALDENGFPRPTRREGRAIDYLVAQHLQATEPSLDEEIFGDHFLFRVQIQQDGALHSRRVLRPTASYVPPDGMSGDEWRAAVAQAWGKHDVPVSSTEEEWHMPRLFVRSFASRSMAKFCGRVRELRRLLVLDQDTTAIRCKLDACWPRDVPRSCPWPEVERHAHRLLDEYAQAETRKVLQAWRAEMAKCGRPPTRWLKQDHLAPTPSLWIESEPADIPEGKSTVTKDAKTGYISSSVEENFHFLRTFWQLYPRVFAHMRQVHVPKQGALVQKGCADVAKLRPIVVQSVMWRIICSALVRRPATREWALQCVPGTCYGGLKGREALQAVIALAEHHAEHKGPVITLDLEKAFDTVDPRLALDVLARAGAPRQWLSLVKRVWLNQTRWIQYAGHTHETPAQVKRSIPQGDALSPLALILLLAAPVKDVEAHEAACGLLQSNFVDDRAASCRTAAQAHRYMQRWTRWSAKFGLLENFDKMEILASERHYGLLRRLGFAAKCLKAAIRVLGVDLTARLQDVVRPTAEKRNEEGTAIAARLMRMPASLHVKRKLWSSRVLSKISWGRGLRLPRDDEINRFSSLYKRVTRRPSLASPWLTSLFEGKTPGKEKSATGSRSSGGALMHRGSGNTRQAVMNLKAFRRQSTVNRPSNALRRRFVNRLWAGAVGVTRMRLRSVPRFTHLGAMSAKYSHGAGDEQPIGAFGLMNLFARSLGGITSDILFKYMGFRGRIWAQFLSLFFEAIFLFCFGLVDNSQSWYVALAVLVCFSLFVQMAEGTSYGIVPFMNRLQLAVVSALVGAGGNLGAVIAGFCFYRPIDDPLLPFQVHAGYVMFWALLSPCYYWAEHGGMFHGPKEVSREGHRRNPGVEARQGTPSGNDFRACVELGLEPLE